MRRVFPFTEVKFVRFLISQSPSAKHPGMFGEGDNCRRILLWLMKKLGSGKKGLVCSPFLLLLILDKEINIRVYHIEIERNTRKACTRRFFFRVELGARRANQTGNCLHH
jgi:hypothetical protein